jgi:serine/threonine protein kinase
MSYLQGPGRARADVDGLRESMDKLSHSISFATDEEIASFLCQASSLRASLASYRAAVTEIDSRERNRELLFSDCERLLSVFKEMRPIKDLERRARVNEEVSDAERIMAEIKANSVQRLNLLRAVVDRLNEDYDGLVMQVAVAQAELQRARSKVQRTGGAIDEDPGAKAALGKRARLKQQLARKGRARDAKVYEYWARCASHAPELAALVHHNEGLSRFQGGLVRIASVEEYDVEASAAQSGGGRHRVLLIREADGSAPTRCLKQFDGLVSGDDGRAAREFAAEVASLALLTPHPNVVQVHGAFVDPGSGAGYVELAYLSGGSLREHLPGLTESVARQVMAEVASGLAHLHASGVIHGDIKPENVVMRDKELPLRPVIVDFDVSLPARRRTTSASTLVLAGTRGYIAPEVLRVADGVGDHSEITTAADMFAFGAILSEFPWADRSVADLAKALTAQDPQSRPAAPAALITLLQGAPTQTQANHPATPYLWNRLKSCAAEELVEFVRGEFERAGRPRNDRWTQSHEVTGVELVASDLMVSFFSSCVARYSTHQFVDRLREVMERFTIPGPADELRAVKDAATLAALAAEGHPPLSLDEATRPANLCVMWHGSPRGYSGVTESGFSPNLSLSNLGFFGRGTYLTSFPEYAAYYAHNLDSNTNPDGADLRPGQSTKLLLCFVALGRVKPVHELLVPEGATNLSLSQARELNSPGYTAHYALVHARNSDDFLLPIDPRAAAKGASYFDEAVVFESAQALPFAIVTVSRRKNK